MASFTILLSLKSQGKSIQSMTGVRPQHPSSPFPPTQSNYSSERGEMKRDLLWPF